MVALTLALALRVRATIPFRLSLKLKAFVVMAGTTFWELAGSALPQTLPRWKGNAKVRPACSQLSQESLKYASAQPIRAVTWLFPAAWHGRGRFFALICHSIPHA